MWEMQFKMFVLMDERKRSQRVTMINNVLVIVSSIVLCTAAVLEEV